MSKIFNFYGEAAERQFKVVGFVATDGNSLFRRESQHSLIKAFDEDCTNVELLKVFEAEKNHEYGCFKRTVEYAKENGANLIVMASFPPCWQIASELLCAVDELRKLPSPIHFLFFDEMIFTECEPTDRLNIELLMYNWWAEKKMKSRKLSHKLQTRLSGKETKNENEEADGQALSRH